MSYNCPKKKKKVKPVSEAEHGKHDVFLCPVQFRSKRGNFGSWDLKILSSSCDLWSKFYMVVSSHSSSTSPSMASKESIFWSVE